MRQYRAGMPTSDALAPTWFLDHEHPDVRAFAEDTTAGLTDEKRQLFRDRLLDCTTEKMRACAEKYLVGKKPALAIVGGAQAAEALASDGWVVTDAEGKPLE